MTVSQDDNSLSALNPLDINLPWTLGDIWIGLGMLAIVQILLVVTVFIFKPQKVYGSFGVVILELGYLLPVIVILGLRRAKWNLLGFRKFTPHILPIGCGLLVSAYHFNQ